MALVLVSWLLNAARPDIHVHSLLSPEGVRWLFRNLGDILSSELLVWLLLCAMAYGCVRDSRLANDLRNLRRLSSRQQFAFMMVFVEVIVIIGVLLLLTVMPHAILLSSTGTLFPSPFSSSIVPVLAISMMVMGITYGVFCQSLPSLSAVYKAMYNGVRYMLPLLPLYMITVLLVNSIVYVFT